MSEVITFWTEILGAVADFLMLEPISWFTAIFVLLAVVMLVKRIIF